jgi:hypothetical protein
VPFSISAQPYIKSWEAAAERIASGRQVMIDAWPKIDFQKKKIYHSLQIGGVSKFTSCGNVAA